MILSGSAEAADDVPWIRDDFVVMQRMTYSPSTDVTTAAPPDAALVDLVQAELPGSDPTPLRVIDANRLRSGWSVETFRTRDGDNKDALELNERDSAIGFADESMIRAYWLSDEMRRALEATGALLFASTDGKATVRQMLADETTADFDVAVVGPDDDGLGSLPRLLLTPAKATELGLASTPGPVVMEAPGMTRDQREAITDVVDEYTEPERIAADVLEPRMVAGGPEQEIVKGVEGFVNVEFSWPNEDIDPAHPRSGARR